MTNLKRYVVLYCFISIFLFTHEHVSAQACYNGLKSRTPYVDVWGGRSQAVKLNLLDLERGSPWHFGFSVGLNAFDFTKITPSGVTVNVPAQGNVVLRADVNQAKIGFNINIVADYRLSPSLNVRSLPGIFFGSRQLDYYREDTQSLLFSMSLSSNYIELPITLKYSALRYSNFRPYIIGGGNVRFNLSSDVNENAQRYIGLRTFEPFAEVGFGFDFYLKYFRLSTEIKLSKGFMNALSNQRVVGYEFYRDALKSMQSNMVSISFHFEG